MSGESREGGGRQAGTAQQFPQWPQDCGRRPDPLAKGEFQMSRKTASARRWRLCAVIVGALALTAMPAFAGSNSTTLPNGAQLTVSIDSPADGTEFLADGAPVSVPVSGTASIGVGPAAGDDRLRVRRVRQHDPLRRSVRNDPRVRAGVLHGTEQCGRRQRVDQSDRARRIRSGRSVRRHDTRRRERSARCAG